MSYSVSINTFDFQNKHKVLEVPGSDEVNGINGLYKWEESVLNDFGWGVKKRTKWHIRVNNRTG